MCCRCGHCGVFCWTIGIVFRWFGTFGLHFEIETSSKRPEVAIAYMEYVTSMTSREIELICRRISRAPKKAQEIIRSRGELRRTLTLYGLVILNINTPPVAALCCKLYEVNY